MRRGRGLRFLHGEYPFFHWRVLGPIEINEAHGWLKLKSPDQESLPMRSAGFRSLLVSSLTIRRRQYFLASSGRQIEERSRAH